ncbi:hypothetical protein NEMIN01_1977 [Nematocida minor]|uniref:uncharacterized protein n=1 Tax=Nematocida minor TaxID=1912983 RepID=UPI0022205A04|nr:uncharacterized protein NEMIN01_1977 [Nematocida minor]KAI5192363.1 hypothetical protein NEMIN01_1977 [Nematocida minor]
MFTPNEEHSVAMQEGENEKEKDETASEKKKRDQKGLTFRITREEMENVKYYLNNNGYFPPGTLAASRAYIKNLAKKFYVVEDLLFYNKPEGDPLLVVSCDEVDRINEILTHFHTENHVPAQVMIPLVQQEYYGISREYISAWVQMCPVCRNIISGKSFARRFKEVVKVVREPWFAICLFSIEWHEIVPGKGGILIFVMDVYSRFTFYLDMPYLEMCKVVDYLKELFLQYGIPEVVKIPEEKMDTEEIRELCAADDIQIVNIKEHPEHFVSETSRSAEMQTRWLQIEMHKIKSQAHNEELKEIIRKQNFTITDRGGFMKLRRIPSDVFFRRVVRSWKTKRSKRFFKRYKILRNDLPSAIELLPEDPMATEALDANPPVKKCRLMRQFDIKTDKEIEREVRPSKDIEKEITMYNSRDPINANTEAPLEEDQCVIKSFKYKGLIVRLVTDSSMGTSEMGKTCIEKVDIRELAKQNNWPIDPPTNNEFWIRRINPMRVEFEPYKFWVIRQTEDESVYEVYNIDKKIISKVRKERIFKAKNELNDKSKSLIAFLFDKFSRGNAAKSEENETHDREGSK